MISCICPRRKVKNESDFAFIYVQTYRVITRIDGAMLWAKHKDLAAKKTDIEADIQDDVQMNWVLFRVILTLICTTRKDLSSLSFTFYLTKLTT